MTDARKMAEEVVNKLCPRDEGLVQVTNAKSWKLIATNEIVIALTDYAKKQTEKLEDKIAEYHNAYEGAKQRNHVLEAELNAIKLKSEPLVRALEKFSDRLSESNECLLASKINCDIGDDGRKLINICVANNHKALEEFRK